MEAKTLVARTWDDLIFINRNKEYGAYPLRKAYSRHVIIGWGVTVAVIALLVFTLGKTDVVKVSDVPPPLTSDGHKLSDVKVLEVRPNPTPPKPQQKNVVRENLPPLVVTTPVEDPVVTEPVVDVTGSSNGVDTGESTTDVGAVGGDSDIPVVVENKGPVLFAEVMPAYTGGYKGMMEFIRKHIKYPAAARRMGIEGTVYIAFVVNGDGSVTNASIVRGISKECDAEAKRVIELMNGWIGGKQNQNPVAVRMTLPITFSLSK